MKFGIHSGLWMARWTDDIAPIFATVADLGFDGVEISLLGMTDERAAALGRLAGDHGLEVTCSDGLSREADISSPVPEVRAAGMDYLRWAVRTTAAMGSRGLAGVIYAPWGVFDPANKADRAKRSAEAFADLDPDLERHDVTLGIEAINRFETDLVNTAEDAVALAAASGSPRVGVLLDTFHMNIEEKDIAAAIVSASDHLVHFHVSDNDRGVPGSGHVPWAEVRRGLADIGYDRWIVAEMFVVAGNPASADLNIWRDIEPDASRAGADAASGKRSEGRILLRFAERFRELEQTRSIESRRGGRCECRTRVILLRSRRAIPGAGAAAERARCGHRGRRPRRGHAPRAGGGGHRGRGRSGKGVQGRRGRGIGHAVRSARRRARSGPRRREGPAIGAGARGRTNREARHGETR